MISNAPLAVRPGQALRDDPPPPAKIRGTDWQQAVFWGLLVYTVIMLVIMGYGFAHVAKS